MPTAEEHKPVRVKLPEERASINRRFKIMYTEDQPDPTVPGNTIRVTQELKLYVIAGMYDDNRLGEVFFRGEKLGTLMSGVLDAMATVMSMALQHGVPLGMITSKLRGAKFGPAQQFGLDDPDFRSCTSIFDLIAQWLDLHFPDGKYNPRPSVQVNPAT